MPFGHPKLQLVAQVQKFWVTQATTSFRSFPTQYVVHHSECSAPGKWGGFGNSDHYFFLCESMKMPVKYLAKWGES